MLNKKRVHPQEKERLHPRNRHRERYDFGKLTASCPELGPFVKQNLYGDASVDFSDPEAVKMLNRALLFCYYDLVWWDVPPQYLCPPVPGRADYLHYMADLLCGSNYGKVPVGPGIKCLDVGVGANCIYPVIGIKEYGWSFVGVDTDPVAIESAEKIISNNPVLQGRIELRQQKQPNDILFGACRKDELIDLTVCNPPFHANRDEARSEALRKLNNLSGDQLTEPVLNFGGSSNELWCKGGEERFIGDMIRQSSYFGRSCFWFSTLVARQSHLRKISEALDNAKATTVRTIPVGQGNKSGRIVAWTFLSPEQQKEWADTRWRSK